MPTRNPVVWLRHRRSASSTRATKRPNHFTLACKNDPVTRIILALAVFLSLLASAGVSSAESFEPTVAVSLGDSYIAGEGGRWLGNTSYDWGDRRGTDRAAESRRFYWRYIEENIYADTYATGCHRSDVAPILSANLAVDVTINLACSGARAVHVRSSATGGQSYRGEPPQADQLAAVAAVHAVTIVVVSVGGNDLGFTDVITDCVAGYLTSTRWAPNTCHQAQDSKLTEALPGAMANVAAVLADLRGVLDANGDVGARIILQGYPSPVAEPTNVRFVETGWDRTTKGGCPFWDADLEWAAKSLVPRITAGLRAVAGAAGAEFLDLSEAMKGHEACAASAQHGTGDDGASAEWIRFVTTGLTQGDIEESLHPNAYGQQAIGRCIALAVQSDPAPDLCRNSPKAAPNSMRLEPG